MKWNSVKEKIITSLIALLIYAGSLFIGVGIFSVMNFNGVFVTAGVYEIYLYLFVSIMASLLTALVLSLSFRNISLLKCFPGIVGPLSYISLVLYFKVYNVSTMILFVIMWIYVVYLFLRSTLPLKDISTPDNKVLYLIDKNKRSYILLYILLGIFIPTVLAYFSFVPLYHYVQGIFLNQDLTLSSYEIVGLLLIVLGMIFSIGVDIPLLISRAKKGDDFFYNEGFWKWSAHPNIYGDIAIYLGLWLYALRFNETWFFIFASLALYLYLFLLIYPYMKKVYGLTIEGYSERSKN